MENLSIVSNLGQVLVQELQEIRGVGDKVVHLRDELATMNAALRIISEADQESVDRLVREWEKQVLDLAYDAEDCTDTYSLCITRPTPHPPSDVAPNHGLIFSWAGYLLSRAKRMGRYPYEKLVLQRTLAADIKALLARTTAVSERRVRYGIDRAALPRAACFALASAASVSTNALRRVDDPNQFVGITEQANALAKKIKAAVIHDQDDKMKAPVHAEDDQIKADDEDGNRLKVFSIVGFGGLGKTTLAMELCQRLDADFPCQALVSVSQGFHAEKDMKGLLVRVLQQIPREKSDDEQIHGMDVEKLYNKIKELLDHKRYLIVIDDVWNLAAWEAIRLKLPENNSGSRIIVTTRIETVAKAASVYFVHHMEPMKLEASKELFMNRVFGPMAYCLGGQEKYMDTILKKCGGMPLAIISIASLLTNYRSVEGITVWERVSRSIGSQMESHPTLERMRQVITLSYDYLPRHLKACMMYLSIFPEHYVIGKYRLLYRWIAEGLVTEKRGLTLLEVAQEYLNELINRNMIQLEKFVLEQYGSTKVEVEGCRVHDMILEVMVSKSKDYGLEKLLDRLGEFKLLRVLDLEDCKSLRDKHMRDVCRLYLLRFLSLRGTNVKAIPDKIGNLEHLETLDIKSTSIGKLLPQTVTKLSKLECLRSNEWLLPWELGNMKALCVVDTGILDGDDVPLVTQEIGKLPQLQVLSIRIETDEFLQESLTNLATSLSKTSTLQSLHLEYYGGKDGLEFLLHVSTPPPLLQFLGVYGRISQLTEWISSLTHLTKFVLGRTELVGDQLFHVLCKLPNLQSIQLGHGSYKGPGLVARDQSFPVLRILKVFGCSTMLTFEKKSMPELETLVLDFGDITQMGFVGVENLNSLKEVKLRGWKSNPAMQRAVEQLKTLSESNKIRVVVDW
ncbi:disease resistance protein RGA5-like [Triticum dicoccoides]|uniref:disease resistance protein RGA5-like n=1 Tax=Triticum dicoccoides TaxID=85692 RepID=UPI00189189A6|nr:disease resistance protein RGA5-like [Triticum dicoccoides]